MKEYHKIQTVYKRDMENKGRTLLERQYSTPEFEYLANAEWVFSEKVDGTNIRVMWDGERVSFGGKTDRAQLPPKLLARMQERFPDDRLFKSHFDEPPVCLYCEGYGANIQKGGGNYRPDQDIVLFDVRVGDWWLKRNDVASVADKLSLEVVPCVGLGNLDAMVNLARQGFTSQWGIFQAEGIVARPAVELFARNGARIITKIKCKDFPRS